MTGITALLATPTTTLQELEAALDALDHAGRVAALRATNRAQQRRLYGLAAGAPALTLDDLVPREVGPLVAVRHLGRNTLAPLPGPFRVFEKRFCRPADGSARLFGYNEGASHPIVGPGYFVADSTAQKPEWQSRGSVVVDYFQVPDGDVVPGWPPVVPNSRGLQMFVFKGTRDFLRRVSRHVSIGAAYKGERSLDHYFTLCRQD